MLPPATEFKRMALDFLFPQKCVGCGKGGSLICPKCRNSLPVLAPPICPLCGLPQASGVLCPNCITWQASIDGIRSPFRFEGAVREAVHQLKYKNIRTLAPILARLLKDYLTIHHLPGDTIVPVPLHPRRLRERGYNQSVLLAAELGKLTGLPVVEDCLARQAHNSPQARTATVEERRKNVAGAFICRTEILKDRRVILLDDVSTSGATVNDCARALKEGGAAAVWGLTVAREI